MWKCLLISLVLIGCAAAWDDDDFEVFDVAEEVDRNFYELLGVAQDASSSDIRAAYRALTLKLHPDKNDAPDADVQFRNLVSVYNIIKDPGKREKYNEVLKNGLPNWRSAVYYYRHVRKMGLLEMSIILFIIITIGQYLVAWASYAEKRYFAEQILGTRIKKIQKKSVRGTVSSDDIVTEFIAEIPKPSFRNTLPCQITRLFVAIITTIPKTPRYISEYYAERRRLKEEQEQFEAEELARLQREEEEAAREKESRGMRRRRLGFKPPERTGDEEPGCLLDPVDEPNLPVKPKPPVITGGFWSDDDLSELVRLVKKYPGGTSGRWERIAETMNRGVQEVTHMAAKLKDNCYRVPGHEQTEEAPALEAPKKVKTKGGKIALSAGVGASALAADSAWSQQQQRALEAALAKHPRGGASDRWDKIAKCVPEKTKEECMLRYKYLVELVKKKTEEPENPPEAETPMPVVSQKPKLEVDDAPTCREESYEDDE